MQLATAVHTTDPTMEQGLEAPAPGTDAGNRGGCADEQSSAHGTARKGEEARHAVKGQASDGPVRDAGPPRRGRLETACAARSLSAEGKLRRAGEARWETSFRDEGKQGEPQDRQQGETNLHGRRGSNRRGGAKPRGRHAGRTGCPPPKGNAATRIPGSGLPGSERWRGDLWTTPREDVRLESRTARIGMRRNSRRQGQEGRAHMLTHVAAPDRRDLEGPGAKSVEGRGGERRSQQPRKRSGISPRGGIG